jgi:hypothetical protein
MTTQMPFSRSVVAVRCLRIHKKNGKRRDETRYFVSSASPQAYTPQQWDRFVRGHWGGVEIRNHWRKDALLLEDKTRSRNVNLVGVLILLRNATLHQLLHFAGDAPLPAAVERLRRNHWLSLHLITNKL